MLALDLATLATTWSYPTTVVFGAGSLAKVARACEQAGLRRPLVVTDPGLAAAAGDRGAAGDPARGGPRARACSPRCARTRSAANVEAGVRGVPWRRAMTAWWRWAAAAPWTAAR